MRERPLLVYDGDCGFCRRWVDHWRVLTGDRVDYAPYQTVAMPGPDRHALPHAVHFVELDGSIHRGAAATFRVLAQADGHGLAWRLYRRLPGFAAASEWTYRQVAAHRRTAALLSDWLSQAWGCPPAPPRHERTARVFLVALALVAAIAFLSLGVQVSGLVGPDGIAPAGDYLAEMARRYGPLERAWRFPTLFWWSSSVLSLQAACALGAAAAAWAVWRPHAWGAFAAMFGLYLSLFYAGQRFTSFQWDLLLLELLFVATVLCRRPRWLVVGVRLLLWRFMLMSGLVKLLGDPGWSTLAALRHHFETQPLPAPPAWTLAALPTAWLQAGVAATLIVELLVPWLFFGTGRWRVVAGAAVAAFQLSIITSGNYGFFNLLVLAMCVTLLDDRMLGSSSPAPTVAGAPARASRLAGGFVVVSALLGLLQVADTVRAARGASTGFALLDAVAPLRIVNRYGPFATMTSGRPTLVVEGSDDGEQWQPYRWRYQPMADDSRPRWNVPHQPRLDWQLWFAGTETPREHPWVMGLLAGLLRGSAPVQALLGHDPFDGRPPAQLRVRLVQLRFAPPELRQRDRWWIAEPEGTYLPPVALGADGKLRLADVEQVVVPAR